MRSQLHFAAAVSALLLAAAAPVPVQESTTATQADTVTDALSFARDEAMRMTVPVIIDGKGPYNFVVDTGSERTVISGELAKRLSLREGPTARIHSMSGVGDVGTVVIPQLQVSAKTVKGINAPALAEHHLGAEGMLGVDSLQTQRVVFDFANNKMTVTPSSKRMERFGRDEIVVRARSRYGRLILADARLGGEKVYVVIDTGSQVSIGNEALRRKLAKRKRLPPTTAVELVSVTGGKIPGELTKIDELKIGGVSFTDMPVAFADVHPFRQLGLNGRPALLLGMNAFKVMDRMAVDFANRKVTFDLPDVSERSTRTRLAAAGGLRSSGSR